MPTGIEQLRAVVARISAAQEAHGHVDPLLIAELATALAAAPEVDVRLLRSLVIVQAHILADLQTVLGLDPTVGRFGEVMALNRAVLAYLG